MRLALQQIQRDGGTQSRATLHQKTIEEYKEAMQMGCSFPPVIVFYDGGEYFLADGFHRVEAATRAGWQSIEVDLKLGSRREAILYGVGANSAHGLRRTPADKHHAVKLLLQDREWGQWSDRSLARATVTSHPFVAKVRATLTGNVSSERIYTTKHGRQALMKTSQIGKSRRSTPPSEIQALQLSPRRVQRLRQYQEQLGVESLEATLDKLLDRAKPTLTSPRTDSTTAQRWLGVSPGLAMVGWAVIEASENDYDLPLVLDYGTIQTVKKRSTSEQLWALEQDLVALVQEFRPKNVALELPLIDNDNPQTNRNVLEAIGVIHLVCYREGGIIPVQLYPSMWKTHLGNGRADPDEVTKTIITLFDLPDVGRAHLDAIAIAYAAFCGVANTIEL